MYNSRKCIGFILGLLTISTPIVAMTKDSPLHFSGPYLGGNIGGAWGTSHYQTNPGCAPTGMGGTFCNVSPDPSVLNGLAVSASGTGKMDSSGFTGGVQGGYNWQIKQVVFGGEADFGIFSLNKSVHVNGTFPVVFAGNQYRLTESILTNWLATFRGRIGMIVRPQLLMYATTGGVLTNYKASSSYADNAIDINNFPGGSGYGYHASNTSGWTAGGGVEWLLTEHCSIKAEYLYMDFGTINIIVPVSNTPSFAQTMQVKTDLNVNVLRFGLNYHFG